MTDWYNSMENDEEENTGSEENTEDTKVDPDYDDKPETQDPASDLSNEETEDSQDESESEGDEDPDLLDDKSESELVVMILNGQKLEVHPSCVTAHEKVGWKVID